jgi:hypothetical protein
MGAFESTLAKLIGTIFSYLYLLQLIQATTGEAFGYAIGKYDQSQADHTFEQANSSGQAELEIQEALPVHPGIDNIGDIVDGERI